MVGVSCMRLSTKGFLNKYYLKWLPAVEPAFQSAYKFEDGDR